MLLGGDRMENAYSNITRIMGQQQLASLRQEIGEGPKADSLAQQTSLDFLRNIIDHAQTNAHPLTAHAIQAHLTNYLHSLPTPTRSRSRSYELLQAEVSDPTPPSPLLQPHCRLLQAEMQWLEDMDEEVRNNITEIMTTQKPCKIRQNFRSLILKLLRIDNWIVYLAHETGRLEFQDFAANYITDLTDHQRRKELEEMEQLPTAAPTADLLRLFELGGEETDGYGWGWTESGRIRQYYIWKKKEGSPQQMSRKVVDKMGSISLLSPLEDETTIIQNYSKDLLDIFELCIAQTETRCSRSINPKCNNLGEADRWLLEEGKEAGQALLARINAFQQLQFQLLQRLRMYKRYVCESDKIFLDFNESATLAFACSNFSHRVTASLSTLWQQHSLFIENIFKEDKLINDFISKAVQQKVKSNKLYELDFETKARVKIDEDGRIVRLHVIIEQLDNSSSHSSSNIYSSSTKILSDSEDRQSDKEDEDHQEQQQTHEEKRKARQSGLIKILEKQNPGILNEGWINLFIKDHHIARKSTHLKHKGKSYTVKKSYSLKRQSSSDCDSPKKEAEPKKLQEINIESTDLNLLKVDEDLLEGLTVKILKKVQFFKGDNIVQESFLNFLGDLHKGYQQHGNPFHNFTHGVNIMHTCYLLAHSPKIQQLLTPFRIFTIIFSGLCHDVGHTGFTNLFEIASNSRKAITYNDISPLENYHAATTFELLRKPENNFLKDLSPAEMKEFRKGVISNILYTDIKEHFPLLKKFQALSLQQPPNEEYMTLLSAMIVHTSDFGGSAKQFEICKEWSLKVNLEFSNQYRQEGELGLPQTPFMKDLTNLPTLSRNEGGFLKVIVLPLYTAMSAFAGPDPRMRQLRQHVESNITRWEQIHSESEKST